MADRKKVIKLCSKIASFTMSQNAIKQMDKENPDFYGLPDILTDEMCDLAMLMKVRKDYSVKELAAKAKLSEKRTEEILEQLSDIGLVEFNWENEKHEKQYNLPIFILGSVENMVKNTPLINKYPRLADFFYDLGELATDAGGSNDPAGRSRIGT